MEHRDWAQAQAHLKRCLEVRPDPEIRLLAARTARQAGDYDEAARALSVCERLDGTTPGVLLEHFLLPAQRGDFTADVESQLWSLVQRNHPDSVLILEAMAQGYIYTYRLNNARACVERGLQLQPDSIQALLWRAQIGESLQSYAEALNDYRRALAIDPANDPARLQLAIFLAFSGRADLAAEHFERLWPRHAQDPQVVLGLARCRDSQGRTKEACELLDALLQERPQEIAALRERGKIALHLGQEALAEEWLRKCLVQDPYDQEATYLITLCLEQRGKKDAAHVYRMRLERIEADLRRLEALNRAVGQAPESACLRHEAGVICLRNGQEREGLRWLTGALQVEPFHGPTHQALADLFESTGQPDLGVHHRRLASLSRPD
jgi:tetratricopeptide (TPR) repeat protein